MLDGFAVKEKHPMLTLCFTDLNTTDIYQPLDIADNQPLTARLKANCARSQAHDVPQRSWKGAVDAESAAGKATEDGSAATARSHCTAEPQRELLYLRLLCSGLLSNAASVALRWWAPGDHSFDCQMACVCSIIWLMSVKNDVWFGYGGSRTGRTALQT